MSSTAIAVENLVKYYDGRCVLDGIDLDIPQGCIYGLLGRNGVGKTTLIRILLGLEQPTRGRTEMLGCESSQLTAETRGRMGYVAEGHHLIQNYRVGKLIELCRSLSLKWDEEFFGHLIDTFRLPMDRKIKQLSAGMRAQLNLSLAMAIDLLQQDGRTILFSSHILSDVERIADRIGILVAGKLVVDCPLEELKQRIRKLRLIFAERPPSDLHLTEVINAKRQGRELVITVANLTGQKQAIIDTFKPASCTEIPMSLEDIFIECTNPAGDNYSLIRER